MSWLFTASFTLQPVKDGAVVKFLEAIDASPAEIGVNETMRSFKDKNFGKSPRGSYRPPASELPPPATPKDIEDSWKQCQELLGEPARAGRGPLRTRLALVIAELRRWLKKFF